MIVYCRLAPQCVLKALNIKMLTCMTRHVDVSVHLSNYKCTCVLIVAILNCVISHFLNVI